MSENSVSPSQRPTQGIQDDEIDLLALIGSLLERKFTIIGITALFCILGVAYALIATPIYRADAIVQVEEKKASLPGMDDLSEALGGESGSNTEIELIRSRRVVSAAVDKLRLDIVVEPVYFPVVGEAVARRNKSAISNDEIGGVAGYLRSTWGILLRMPFSRFEGQDGVRFAWGGEKVDIQRLVVPPYAVGEQLTLIAGKDETYSLYGPDDELVLTGKVGRTTEETGYEIYVETLTAKPGTLFEVFKKKYLGTVIDYQKALSISERGKDSGILSLAYENKHPHLAQEFLEVVSEAYVRQNVERQSAEAAKSLEFLRDQLPGLKKDLEEAERKLNDYQVEAGSVNITAEAEVLLNQVVEIESKIAELQLEKSEIDRRFTTDHPQYIAWQEQMAELKSRKADLDKRVRNLPQTQQDVLSLRRDLEVGTEIYTQMLNNIQELDIVRAGTVGNVRIVDEAVVNTQNPVKPKKALIVVIATLLGGFIGVAYVLIRNALNRGVENSDDIEALGLPVYASIPESDNQRKFDSRVRSRHLHHPEGLLTWNDPTDIAVESLRSLRTSLHFAMLEAKNNVIVVSGPSPGVGKSFITGNLAAVIAQTGQRVLVMDTDLRRGYLHKMFDIDGKVGLSDILGKRAEVSEAIQQTRVSNLHVLPRGKAPPNPSELLMREEFTELMEQLNNEFDLVLVDTPPIMAVTDATIVAQHAGVSMLVVRFGKNPVKEIDLCRRRCEQNGINIKGVILNAVERRGGVYGYRYGYHYYHYEYKPEGK